MQSPPGLPSCRHAPKPSVAASNTQSEHLRLTLGIRGTRIPEVVAIAPQPSLPKCWSTRAAVTTEAVSVRRTCSPSDTATAPAATKPATSPSESPPSGQMTRQTAPGGAARVGGEGGRVNGGQPGLDDPSPAVGHPGEVAGLRAPDDGKVPGVLALEGHISVIEGPWFGEEEGGVPGHRPRSLFRRGRR